MPHCSKAHISSSAFRGFRLGCIHPASRPLRICGLGRPRRGGINRAVNLIISSFLLTATSDRDEFTIHRFSASSRGPVFEMAALARLTSIPTLMLVSNRVELWVEPILYRVIPLSSSSG
ncbi:hypothetical protein MVEN_00118200 [Mycena venus]|uniref:Uncharacterized protein n=1 Tax=Mycena venus TaxID=2733690 RepID=A0A8H6Z7Z2_9AGAR|nr:hypothetical protein MVEN_00118200 [Mycena venus]